MEHLNNADYQEVDGIRRYGEPAGLLTIEQVAQFEVTPESVLHVTRHFQALSPEARAYLKTLGVYDDVFIDAQLASIGSKFHDAILDPRAMIEFSRSFMRDRIQAGQRVEWFKKNGTGERVLKFVAPVSVADKARFHLSSSELFGTRNIMRITPEVRPQVKIEQRGQGEARDRINVNVLHGAPIPWTDELIIDLVWSAQGDHPRLDSIYTGIRTAAFPNREQQSEDEFAYNQSWWDAHTFLV